MPLQRSRWHGVPQVFVVKDEKTRENAYPTEAPLEKGGRTQFVPDTVNSEEITGINEGCSEACTANANAPIAERRLRRLVTGGAINCVGYGPHNRGRSGFWHGSVLLKVSALMPSLGHHGSCDGLARTPAKMASNSGALKISRHARRWLSLHVESRNRRADVIG